MGRKGEGERCEIFFSFQRFRDDADLGMEDRGCGEQ